MCNLRTGYFHEVWNLTLTMLSEKYIKCKAAETHGLLAFVMEMFQKYQGQLMALDSDSQFLFQILTYAGRAAQAFDAVLASYGREIDVQGCQQLFQHYQRFISLCDRAAVPILPKAHLMYHCVQNANVKGNPRHYTTYIDESYNGAIARVCRSVHRRGFAMAVYRKLSMLEQLSGSGI